MVSLSAEQERELDLMEREFHTVPEVRHKQLWQHAVIRWLHRTQPSERFLGILVAYMEGRPEGIRAFEQASRLMRMEQKWSTTTIKSGWRHVALAARSSASIRS